jgi:hypothetical protein
MRRKNVRRCHSCRQEQAPPPHPLHRSNHDQLGRAGPGGLTLAHFVRVGFSASPGERSQHTIYPSRGDSDPRTAVEFRVE